MTKPTLKERLETNHKIDLSCFEFYPENKDYLVSKSGIVISLKYNKPKKLKQRITKGYPQVGLFHKDKCKRTYVHKMVAITFIGKRPKGLEINHIDGNKLNNDFSNLEYVTPSENRYHAFRIGLRSNRGNDSPSAKLREKDIFIIRKMLRSGIKQKIIAKKFNVTEVHISSINTGRNWGWLK